MTFPLPLESLFGQTGMYLLFALIGFGFGYALEISGFGNSKKLAGQFYFTDQAVIKVFFTAIVTGMVLIFIAVGVGILDFSQIWVNPTYLWSGIVGGLIMGVGFIVGGFCPGTSLISLSTLKIDGLFYVLGGLFGAFLFGETEQYFTEWWNFSGYYGRLTLMDVFNVPTGVVVLAVVLMALFVFWGAEQMERIVAKKDITREPKIRVAGAALLIAAAVTVLLIGDASLEEKWSRLAPTKTAALDTREVQIQPAEVFATRYDNNLSLVMLDVRSEADYNLYHIAGATNAPLATFESLLPHLAALPPANTIYVVMSNDETDATQAWKILTASSIPNAYILDGGINNWIAFFGEHDPLISPANGSADEMLKYNFPAALGARYESADPSPIEFEHLEFIPKIKLENRRDKSGGGCG